ncbi:MFS general substrate transporter [Apiospora arundinis]
MDYGRRSDRYDESPPRHRAPTPRSADRASTGTTESTYVHDGKDYYTTAHRRQVSDSDRPQYREEKYYYELPPSPPKNDHVYYEEVERRRRPAHMPRQISYSADPAVRNRRISHSSTKISSSRSEDRNHHNQRRHSQQQHPRDKKTISSTKKSDTMGGLDLNWKQAAEAAAGAAAVEAWRSHGNRDQIKRVATAAAGAVAVDLALGRGVHDDKNKRHAMESAIGGLVIDRMVNGSSSKKSSKKR